jgi:hypothetical protein
MIRPTTIPHTLKELQIEQAVAREALRLAFEQHKSMAVGLKGIQQERTISDAFAQTATGASLVEMMGLDLLVGSGGALSHAPRRNQSALMMIDGFLPEGITRLAVDSIFMMPQLGVLSTVHEKSATDVFVKDCLIWLGTCVAPVGVAKPGSKCLRMEMKSGSGETVAREVAFGEVELIPLPVGETAEVALEPARSFDCGEGRGKRVEAEVTGGVVGVIIDCRGRPLSLPESDSERAESHRKWNEALNIY